MPFDEYQKPFVLTIIHQLAMHLLAACNGNLKRARECAADALGRYDAQTEVEVRMVARVIGCSLQANEALAQAADPAMTVAHQLRLRTSAVSLNREADKAECRLQKLQEARRQVVPDAPQQKPPQQNPGPAAPGANQSAAAPAAAAPVAAPAAAPVAAPAAATVAAYAKAAEPAYSQSLQQRQREQNLAALMMKDAERAAAAVAAAMRRTAPGTGSASGSGKPA